MRTALIAILHTISGIFIVLTITMSFASPRVTDLKWGAVLIFFLPAAIALWGALELSHYSNWQKHVGITLLIPSAMMAVNLLGCICMLASDETSHLLSPQTLHRFSDYWSGAIVLIGVALTGFGLVAIQHDQS